VSRTKSSKTAKAANPTGAEELAAKQAAEQAAAAQAAAAAGAGLTGDMPDFPAPMRLINDTAQEWVLGGVHVSPSSYTDFTARDADHVKRVETDCKYILELSDHYRPVEAAEGDEAAPAALRVVAITDSE
jgi:hypothetical protein